jgi:hypothetical protein
MISGIGGLLLGLVFVGFKSGLGFGGKVWRQPGLVGCGSFRLAEGGTSQRGASVGTFGDGFGWFVVADLAVG